MSKQTKKPFEFRYLNSTRRVVVDEDNNVHLEIRGNDPMGVERWASPVWPLEYGKANDYAGALREALRRIEQLEAKRRTK